MTIEEMKEQKRQKGLTNLEISHLSGVPLGTVQKVFSGITKSPRYDTLVSLERIFTGIGTGKFTNDIRPVFIKDAEDRYSVEGSSAKRTEKRQGEYTVDDYLRLPDDQRYELIDGYLFIMEAPTPAHQMLAGLIYHDLCNYVFDKGGDCLPFISPIDVQLDNDEKTMVQPDVLVVCDRAKISGGRCHGSPDLIIEVLSPSTRTKDMILKLDKYFHAGVKEYWLVDIKKKRIMVYTLREKETDCAIYGFDDQIPVGIYGGECVIDFKMIWERSSWLEG